MSKNFFWNPYNSSNVKFFAFGDALGSRAANSAGPPFDALNDARAGESRMSSERRRVVCCSCMMTAVLTASGAV